MIVHKEETLNSRLTHALPPDIILNSCQDTAIKKIWNWYHGYDPTMTLAGSAGTGKSFVTSIVAKILYTSIAITAPTHKAKNVIANFTGLPALTIHKLLGLRLNTDIDNFDIHNVQFDRMVEPEIKNYKIVICDDRYDFLVSEANKHKCKILFVDTINNKSNN